MNTGKYKPGADLRGIWILFRHLRDEIEESVLGLAGESRHLFSGPGWEEEVTGVAIGSRPENGLQCLGEEGIEHVLYLRDASLAHYHGELYAKLVHDLAIRQRPRSILMVHGAETGDLSSRLAARMDVPLVTRAVDLKAHEDGAVEITRPVSNGYLYEKVRIEPGGPFIITFLPSALNPLNSGLLKKAKVSFEAVGTSHADLKTRLVKVMEASGEDLELEDADVVVAGGRGVGKGEAFHVIHELATVLGGAVAGTRPIIDWQTLPHDRQIGQTGKTVTADLLIACGISGANEFTAGMEKSRLVIAINKDPHARIFRFADLGVIGDLRKVLPELIRVLKERGRAQNLQERSPEE